MISINTLLNRLGHHPFVYKILHDKNQQISSVRLLKYEREDLRPDILYVAKSSDLSEQIIADLPMNILCVEDDPISQAITQFPKLNLMVLDKYCDINYVTNEIYKLVDSRHLSKNLEKLFSVLAHRRGLQNIVDIGYEILGNPFTVNDITLKCLAFTNTPAAEDDPIWCEFVKGGYMSWESFLFYTSEKLIQKLNQNQKPFYWDDHIIKYPRLLSRIAINNKPIGFFGALEVEKPFSEEDYEIVTILCNAISSEMQKNSFVNYSRGYIYEEFIEDLLGDRIKDSRILLERKSLVGLKLKKNIYVLSISINQNDMTPAFLAYTRNKLEDMFIGSKGIVYNDKIVMLISCDNEKKFFQSDLINLEAFLKKSCMQGGISRCFHNLEDVSEHYHQSLDALNLGSGINKNSALHGYDKNIIPHIAEICSNNSDLKKLCHPSLFLLMEYDRQHNTAFTESLSAYVLNLKNSTDTANALKLHRNSLTYRIERIEEIIGVDLNDNDTLLHLYLSFKFMEYLNVI